MKIKITHNNLTFERAIPTKWEDVTFGQFLKIMDCKTDSETFSVLTGVDHDVLQKAKIKGADKVISLLSFMRNTKPDLGYLPKTILGYKIPPNLEFEQIAVYEDLKGELRDTQQEGNEQIKKYPLYVAMFVCDQIYGEYDYERAKLIAPQFLNAPASEVLAVGNFTLLKLIALRSGTNPSLQLTPTRWRKFKLALISWVRALVFTVRFYIWKKRHLSNDTNSLPGQ
jgi:hypothetical protein